MLVFDSDSGWPHCHCSLSFAASHQLRLLLWQVEGGKDQEMEGKVIYFRVYGGLVIISSLFL
jgi:hypothetical protein